MVGYQKLQLNPGYNMCGVQFSNLNGEAKDLSTVVTLDDSYAGYSDDYDHFTTMRVWDGIGYITYGWAGTSGTDVDGEPELDNTWVDYDCYAVEGETMPIASAMWIRAEKAGTMLISGEVLTEEISISLEPGYNMVANPYPCAVPVSTFGQMDSSYAGYSDDYDHFTTMRVWDGIGYVTYGWAGTSGTDVDGEPELDNTWVDYDCYATEDIVPAGAGVWIRAEKTGTINFAPLNNL